MNLFQGDSRSNKAKKNILVSAVIKVADTLIYLLLVPLTLGYLNAYEYGVWLTLSSVLSWVDSFDIGLGNGLRNKLAIALANNEIEKARGYVSTTFFMLIIVSLIIFFVGSILVFNVDWYIVLNVNNCLENLREIVWVSFMFFCLNFIFKFIGNVYQAQQLSMFNYLLVFSGHLVSLVFIWVLTRTGSGNLMGVAVAYSASLPIIYLICYPVTFKKLYPSLSPSVCFFKKEYLNDLLSLGMMFFVVQVMSVVLFSLSNLIISNMFGPDQVTPYNIAYRYFSVIIMVFNLMLAPLWSATTDAYAKGELQWIRNSVKNLMRIFLLIIVVVAFMIIASPIVYALWVGEHVEIPYSMSVIVGIYSLIIIYSLSYSNFLNGMGKLKLQLINIIIAAVLFFPICYLFGRWYGLNGILIGMCIVNVPGAILNTIQLKLLINQTAKGVWNK